MISEVTEILVPNTQTDEVINNVCDDQTSMDQTEIFQSEHEMKKSLTRLCYGDLYIIGRLWIEAMKKVLVGNNVSLIPVVSAAAKACPPSKPPPMKYTDLPLYKSPHYEYKDYIEDSKKCPKAKVKILHQYLLPKVRCFRKDFEQCSCEAKCAVLNKYYDARKSLSNATKDFKKNMRDPDNLAVRQAVVFVGGATGFLLGSGRGIPRRLIFTSIGLLSTGALCFPKETDAAFREFAYYSTKFLFAFYNNFCRKELSLRERVPCKEDLPPPTLPRKPQCPPKNKK